MIGGFWTNPGGGGTSDLVLGTTSTTAHRGDRGNEAWTHSQNASLHSNWKSITDFNTQATGTSTIEVTADKTADLLPGRCLKYKVSGIDYYGIAKSLIFDDPNWTLTINGAPLTTGPGDLEGLWYTSIPAIVRGFIFNGAFATVSSVTLIDNFLNMPGGFPWDEPKAHFVGMRVGTRHNDKGAPTTDALINATIDGSTVFSSGIEIPNGGFVTTGVNIITTNYTIAREQRFEITVTKATGGTPNYDANTLFIFPFFVLELN